MVKRALLLVALAMLVGCEASPTAIIVVTDTDVAVPAQGDFIHLEVTSPNGSTQSADADLLVDPRLPRTTTLVWETGPLGPFIVHAVLRRGGGDVVDRTARVSFDPERTVVLRLDLLARCVAVACGADRTCGDAGCQSVDVDAAALPSWSGQVPTHLGMVADGGPPDGGAPPCVASDEVCNTVDDDCDGRVDETTDLAADPNNCGGCDHACAVVPSSSPSCVLGVCRPVCATGFADCNGEYGDGCETNLATVRDCGGCALECTVSHGTPSCATGTCSLATCAVGWDSCDRSPGVPDINGCETSVSNDPARCGGCDRACPSPAHSGPICSDGVCRIACDAGFADCNGRIDDGCEASLSDAATCGGCTTTCRAPTALCSGSVSRGFSCVSACPAAETLCGASCVDTTQSTENCGACGIPCPTPAHGASACIASACGLTCDLGYANCNGTRGDGCETPLVTIANCGGCGVVCAPPHATGVCGDGTCDIGACAMGWADCNGRVDDGCEVHVAIDPTHCGSCTTSCPPRAHASPICSGGCGIACQAGFADCNSDVLDGCERDLTTPTDCGSCGAACAAFFVCQRDPTTGAASCVSTCGGPTDPTHMLCGATCATTSSDPQNCGVCANVCPTRAHSMPTCAMSTCGVGCDVGYGNCDADVVNGCETDVSVTVAHCGGCGIACPPHAHAAPTCSAGTCGQRCDAGYVDCTTADGCETALGTLAACLRCGDVCPRDPPHTRTSACSPTGCVITCDNDHWDCDGSVMNGCELRLDDAPDACTACGRACAATEVCCGYACVAGTVCPP